MTKAAFDWYEEELEAGRPPDRLKVSEWIASNVVLGKHSAIKGPYPLEMVPFFVPFMDRCNNPDIDEQVLCKPAQIGGTQLMVAIIGYYCDQDPSSILLCLADQDTAEYMLDEKIKPMFEDSENLARLYDPKNFTKKEIKLPNGGYIAPAWASSVAKLASKPMRVVVGDEIDKPGYMVTTAEAGAISLMRERTNSYPMGYSLVLLLSTPTVEEGNIITELESCDIIYDWHVPCPYCRQYQPLKFSSEYCYGFEDGVYRGNDGKMHSLGQVVWEGGRDATKEQIFNTARYQCGECGELWTTIQKNDAVRAGKEVSRTEPTGFDRKVGLHINRIYSLFDGGRLDKIVSDWVGIYRHTGEKRRKELQGFVNSTLAEPWKQVVVKANEAQILKARCDLEPQVVPQDAVMLTCGIDVQKHEFWYVVRAWANDEVSWLVDYGRLRLWDDVENLLFNTRYPVHDSNEEIGIWRAGIDTGGGEKYGNVSMTEETVWWVKNNEQRNGCNVFPIKGATRPIPEKVRPSQQKRSPSGKPIRGGYNLYHLDTDSLKNAFHYRLEQAANDGPQAAYLNNAVGKDYARQIEAEERRLGKKGVFEWVQTSRNNHLFDAEIYALALSLEEWPGAPLKLIKRRVNCTVAGVDEKSRTIARPKPQKARRW